MNTKHLKISFLSGCIVGLISLAALSLYGLKDSGFLILMSGLIIAAMAFVLIRAILKMIQLPVQRRILALHPILKDEEFVQIEGPVRMLTGSGPGFGKLVLTGERLIFIPSNENQAKEHQSYPFSEIEGVELFRNPLAMEKGIVLSSGGSRLKYLLDYPEDWKTLLEKVCGFHEASAGP